MIPEVSNWFYVSRHSATFNESSEYENINEMDSIALEYLSKTNYDKIICLRRFIRASSFFIMNKLCARGKYTYGCFQLIYQYQQRLNSRGMVLKSLVIAKYSMRLNFIKKAWMNIYLRKLFTKVA